MVRGKEDTHGQTINAIPPGGAASLEKIDFGGALEARRMPSGAVWLYWRYTADGRTERVRIGRYDSAAPPKSLSPTTRGFSVAAARVAARDLAQRNADEPGGLRGAREREKVAQDTARHAQAARQKYTLAALCKEYCDWLERQKKSSHRDARNLLTNHLLRPRRVDGELAPDGLPPYSAVALTPATIVAKREIVEAVRKLSEAGKSATARKLRSYLRAAYACAAKADSDPALPSAFIAFNVTSNPVEATAAIRGRADKNPLSVADLRRYWKELQEESGVTGAALRLHILSGAQRTAQLVRITAPRDLESGVLRLQDLKGKRAEPRPHLVPITKAMQAELEKLPKKGFALSSDGGTTPMHPTTLSAWAADVGRRAKIEGFQLKRVRSGVETALASIGIPLHIRGQLQSHGISGVQATHYDAHEYLAEKRAALDALHALLERKESKKVTPIGQKGRAA